MFDSVPDAFAPGRFHIREAVPASDMDEVRRLFREYADSLPFSLCFQGFEDELRTLPGRYSRPHGVIYLAQMGSANVGCIAVRPISVPGDAARLCEMKRMYVSPFARRAGIGRALAQYAIDEARRLGYDAMNLDSEDNFVAAVALYRALGFREIPRYNDDPHPHTIWMRLDLK